MTNKEIKGYLVVDGDGLVLYADNAYIVPIETLPSKIKDALDDGDYDVFQTASVISISMEQILKTLEDNGLLEPMLKECRAASLGNKDDK